MSQNTSQYENLNDILKKVAAEVGTSPDKLKQATKMNPKLEAAINNLTDADIAKISSIINDKETSAKILATPQAQEILKKLKKS